MPMRARKEPAASPEITTSRLDHLPIIAQILKRLRVASLIDDIVPPDPRSHVTTGQCVEALVLAVLTGTHTLYKVDKLLGRYDLETIMGWRDEDGPVAARFSDVRLGNSLVSVFQHGHEIQARVVVEAIRAFELVLKWLHLDATSVKTFGTYRLSQEPEDPDGVLAIPHVTHGHSKDHRPDLKQILFGLAVTGDGSVPVWGRAASGNRADALEDRFAITRLASILPDPTGSTLVADSKFFAGETLLLARKYHFHYLTLMPHTVGLREEAFVALQKAKATSEGLPLLKEVGSDLDGTAESWRGLSTDLVYQYKDEAKVVTPIPLRCLAVESSSLRKLKGATLTREKAKERERLERKSKRLLKQELTCDKDAEAIAKQAVADLKPRFHKVTPSLCAMDRRAKRTRRGRPAKDEPETLEVVWSSSLTIEDDPEAFQAILDRESTFVLATDHPKTGPGAVSDADVLRRYTEEFKVESCFKSSKGPLEIAPVFLKTPKRLAGLALVYVIALMVHTLVQREVRARLATEKKTIPGNLGRTAQPTTEVVFSLMQGVSAIRSGPGSSATVTGMTTEQAKLLSLLGNDLLTRPSLEIQTPTPPKRDQCGYVPPKHRTQKCTQRRSAIPRM